MYSMTTKIEIPVTTLSNGTALVTVAPMFAFHNPSPGVNAGTLPFVSVANGNTDFPFAATPTFTASPFAGQGPNTSTYAIDAITLDFTQT